MYKFLTRNGQTLAFGLGVLITLIFLFRIFSGLEQFSMLADEERFSTSIFDLGIYAAIALIVIGALSMLVFGVVHIASDPKGSIKGIIGLAAIVAIFFIMQATSGTDSEALAPVIKEFDVSPSQSALISGAIGTALVMAGIAVVAFVASEIRNFFK